MARGVMMMTGQLGWAALTIVAAVTPAMAQTDGTVRLRDDAPVTSATRARALTPAALGDLLLVPGHRPVLEATVGPEGMEAPVPPGGFVPVRLYLQPAPSSYRGFCERTVVTALLRMPDTTPNVQPTTDSVFTTYHWSASDAAAPGCTVQRNLYFPIAPADRAAVTAAVRLLAAAHDLAGGDVRLPFPASVEDPLATERLAYEQAHPDAPKVPNLAVITDPRAALAALPIAAISYAGPAETASPRLLNTADRLSRDGRTLPAYTFFIGGDWIVAIAVDGDRIARLRLRRAVPPPF